MRGPIDYILVGFSGRNYTGEILDELRKVSENGTIKVLDLLVVDRDANGVVSAVKVSDIEGILAEPGIISQDDIQEVGELMEDDTAAGFLVVEQLWAVGLKQAIANAGGTLLQDGRIHPEATKELEAEA